jgi:hypothetical protein
VKVISTNKPFGRSLQNFPSIRERNENGLSFCKCLFKGRGKGIAFSLLDRQMTMSGQYTLPCQTESDVNFTKRNRLGFAFRFYDHTSEYRAILPESVAFFTSHIVACFPVLSVPATSFFEFTSPHYSSQDRADSAHFALTATLQIPYPYRLTIKIFCEQLQQLRLGVGTVFV